MTRPQYRVYWVVKWWRKLMEYFAPGELGENPEEAHRAQLVAGLALLGGAFGSAYASFYFAIGHIWGAWVIVFCTISMVSVPFIMRATGRLRLAGNLHCLTWTLGFTALAALEGGVHGHAIAWLACGVPLLALLILDVSTALIWCVICFLATLFFCILDVVHITLPVAYPESWRAEVSAAGYIGFAVFMSLLGVIFEQSRRQAFCKMQHAFQSMADAHQRSHESERFVQSIADATPGLVYMIDLNSRSIIYANRRLAQVLGLKRNRDLRIAFRDLRPLLRPFDLDRALEDVSDRLRGAKDGDVIETEYQVERGRKGNAHWLFRNTVFARAPSGEPACILGLAEDVTARKRIERAQHEAEGANRAKDDFIAALSHELRTPLTPVLMLATTLESDESLSPDHHEQIRLVRQNVELEARLIDDLLDLTKVARGKFSLKREPINLQEVLSRSVEIVRGESEGKNIELRLELEARISTSNADPTRIQQVFWNLLRNAIKFTPAGGCIRVRSFNTNSELLSIEVQDSGVGIPPADLGKIFRPFEQGAVGGEHRFGGLGLGLAISKAITDLHGGFISVASEGLNRGATFTVRIPVSQATLVPGTQQRHPLRAEFTPHLHILLVEDNESIRTVLARLLSREGHEVETAETCAEAREAAHHQPPGDPIQLLISDLGLPDGSGLSLVQELKSDTPDIKAIALSGYGTDDDIQKSLQAGFSAHLTKPIAFDDLRRSIAAA